MNETEFFKKIKPVENQVGATTTKEDEFFKSLGVSQEGETQETKQDLTTAQNIGDITASAVAGSATGLSYLLDIEFLHVRFQLILRFQVQHINCYS